MLIDGVLVDRCPGQLLSGSRLDFRSISCISCRKRRESNVHDFNRVLRVETPLIVSSTINARLHP